MSDEKKELLALIVNFVPTREGIITICITIGLTFLYRLNIIYDFWDKFSKREIIYLQELLKENRITGKTGEVIQEYLNSKIFRYVTKINVEKHLREKIIELHELANGRLTYANFRNARRFLTIDSNGDLKLRIIREFGFEKIYWIFHNALSIIFWFLFCFFFLFSLSIPIDNVDDLKIRGALFIFSISCFALAIYSLKETFPLTSAKKIKEEMKTFYRNSADQVSLYYNSTSQTMSKRILSEEEKEIARKRFESHFGEIESSDLTSIDNETIDADLAQEYSSNHQED